MSERVLICDDNAAFRSALGRALARKGLDVLIAGSAHQALAMARATPPDFAVLDLHMPKSNGLILLTELRMLKEDLKVMILTGAYSWGVGSAALRLGAHACRSKPADAEEVLEGLRGPRAK